MIWDLRMPRTVIGIIAGGALAVAGALLQTITRNPLAASDTLGINAGAYFIVVLGAILFPGCSISHLFCSQHLAVCLRHLQLISWAGTTIKSGSTCVVRYDRVNGAWFIYKRTAYFLLHGNAGTIPMGFRNTRPE